MRAAPPELVSAAEWLYDEGELDGPLAILHFFERPERYPELLSRWDEEIAREDERQDERRALA